MTDRQKRRAEARRLAKKQNKESQISEAQLAASQANAKLSTGPSSIEGKAVSSQNNFRHGLTQTGSDFTFLEGNPKKPTPKPSPVSRKNGSHPPKPNTISSNVSPPANGSAAGH